MAKKAKSSNKSKAKDADKKMAKISSTAKEGIRKAFEASFEKPLSELKDLTDKLPSELRSELQKQIKSIMDQLSIDGIIDESIAKYKKEQEDELREINKSIKSLTDRIGAKPLKDQIELIYNDIYKKIRDHLERTIGDTEEPLSETVKQLDESMSEQSEAVQSIDDRTNEIENALTDYIERAQIIKRQKDKYALIAISSLVAIQIATLLVVIFA